MAQDILQVESGVSHLDTLLGGLRIGDNVVWYDNAGSLAPVFCLNFIKASQSENKSIIYLNFDLSIKNLMEQLGPLADYPQLTVLDCFTFGKGEGAEVFLRFYEDEEHDRKCRIIRIDEPRNADHVTGAFYGLHKTMVGDVRFIFDSLTGMQELWGGEEQILKFYSHSCPRLYELNTVAYWIVEKEAHSQRLRAHINKIAQVAINLSLKRGKTSLTIVKAQNRNPEALNKPFNYWSEGIHLTFDSKRKTAGRMDLGLRLKDIRKKRGISQTDLAKLIGVTPSTISQIESNQIFPSLPALLKISEILSVEIASFFQETYGSTHQVVFSQSDGTDVTLGHLPKNSVHGKLVTPLGMTLKAEPYILEIAAGKNLSSHFFVHKGEEMGYLLSGTLEMLTETASHTVKPGDIVYLKSDSPLQWKNPGPEPAKLLWVKIK